MIQSFLSLSFFIFSSAFSSSLNAWKFFRSSPFFSFSAVSLPKVFFSFSFSFTFPCLVHISSFVFSHRILGRSVLLKSYLPFTVNKIFYRQFLWRDEIWGIRKINNKKLWPLEIILLYDNFYLRIKSEVFFFYNPTKNYQLFVYGWKILLPHPNLSKCFKKCHFWGEKFWISKKSEKFAIPSLIILILKLVSVIFLINWKKSFAKYF